jgi:hypothetical protein
MRPSFNYAQSRHTTQAGEAKVSVRETYTLNCLIFPIVKLVDPLLHSELEGHQVAGFENIQGAALAGFEPVSLEST